jgi:hypothetical protein
VAHVKKIDEEHADKLVEKALVSSMQKRMATSTIN